MLGRRARFFGFLGKIRNLIFFRNPKNLAPETLSPETLLTENSAKELVPVKKKWPHTPVVDQQEFKHFERVNAKSSTENYQAVGFAIAHYHRSASHLKQAWLDFFWDIRSRRWYFDRDSRDLRLSMDKTKAKK